MKDKIERKYVIKSETRILSHLKQFFYCARTRVHNFDEPQRRLSSEPDPSPKIVGIGKRKMRNSARFGLVWSGRMIRICRVGLDELG